MPQVGTDDHAGQDAQPALQLLPLLGGVRSRFSPRRRKAGTLVSFYRPFSSRSSVSVSAGLQTGLAAVDAGCPASLLTSLRTWKSERYPSEGTTSM